MPSYGIKISLPGIDVRRAKREELAVTTAKDSLKVDTITEPLHYGAFQFYVVAAAGQNKVIKTIEHGLGYAPQVLAHFVKKSDNTSGLLPYVLSDEVVYLYYQLMITANTKNVVFSWFTNPSSMPAHTGPVTFDVRYYIFSNKVKDL